jgi:PAS domain S-box-containing protein
VRGRVQALLILLVCGSLTLGALWVRRPDTHAIGYWVSGWMAAGAGGVLLLVRDAFPQAFLLAFPLGTLFPMLLLAGALVLAGRRIPGWLLPGALLYGLARAGVAAAGYPALAWAGAAVEPVAVLAAAWIIHRAQPRGAASRSQRLLAPSFVVLALIGTLHVALMTSEGKPPAALVAIWVAAIPSLFGLQVHAEWERARRALLDARDQLEERVAARTHELARVNASLRESEARYRVASELGSDFSFGFSGDTRETIEGGWVSDAFLRMSGYSLADLKGSSWLSLLHPDDLPRIRAEFTSIVAGHARELELRLIAKDGRVLTLHARLLVKRDAGGVRVVGVARDVTEARRAEQERRALERRVLEAQRHESLAVLTGGVAHDFNNLLMVILGNARIALAETPPESTLHARLTRIRAAAEHGARLTEQMLAYAGKSSLALKPLELSHLVEDMADLLRAAVSERCRLELDLDVAARAPVEGDATQLQQVVLNLVTNASESLAGASGTVRVRTGRCEVGAAELAGAAGTEHPEPGRYAFLEVSDDGPGMDAATRSRIFQPFFTTKFSGRGLGLAAVLGIVRAHSGVVQVKSEPGAGASLRVLIPEARGSVARAARPAAATPVARARETGTVLVVDDQDSVLELAQIVLESAGHRVLTALGGRAGIERFREQADEIDVVWLDLGMPDADGEEVLRELKRLRPDVRVIIATGYAGDSQRIPAGVRGFVRKPYEPEEMLDQVARALSDVR